MMVISPLVVGCKNLRAFGPGLNPFAPHGMGMLEDRGALTRRQILGTRSFRLRSADRDDRGWTLLHIGARKGDLREVRNLGKTGNLLWRSCFVCHPVVIYCGNFVLKVKRLLDEGMDVNVLAWGPKSPGVTPLHLAAQGGHVKVMDALLERGANIDARTKGACGWTPLHTAAKERNKEAIKFLIENGAFLPDDINDNRFNPPVHYCPGLEWAYEIKRLLAENSLSSGETSCGSES